MGVYLRAKFQVSNIILKSFRQGGGRWVILPPALPPPKNPEKVHPDQGQQNKQADIFAPKTLRDKFGGVNIKKNFLGIDRTPPSLERSFKAATKLKAVLTTDLEMESIPAMVLSSLVQNIHVKT